MFESENVGFGGDLVAMDIQRGKDHGFPGYNVFRKVCGLKPIDSFADLDQVMRNGSAQTFSKLYE